MRLHMNLTEQFPSGFKAGVVALLGKPNVGKSSLINRLIGTKVNIVSNKPQTTRYNILCIYNAPDLQVIFKDMPGVHTPKHKLGQHLVDTAKKGLEATDIICYMVEANTFSLSRDDLLVRDLLLETQVPFVLIINKIDLVRESEERVIERIKRLYCDGLNPLEIIVVSARTGFNLDYLVELFKRELDEGYPYYPDDIIIDRSERFLASEYIREKIFQLTEMEVPHSTAVRIEDYRSPDEYPERKDLYIRANIYVERDSQKKIIIGSGGRMIKKIGRMARIEIERLTGHKVYLDLWIKVKKGWRKSSLEVHRMGYK